jgi:hypothetical protein
VAVGEGLLLVGNLQVNPIESYRSMWLAAQPASSPNSRLVPSAAARTDPGVVRSDTNPIRSGDDRRVS